MKVSTHLLFLTAPLLQTTCAYDIGCLWPASLGDDLFTARTTIEDLIKPIDGTSGILSDYNQPTTARTSLYLDGCSVLCLAFHDPLVLNPFTKFPTFMTVPSFGHNAYSMAMCSYQCMMYVYEDMYDIMPGMELVFNGIGVNVNKPSDRVDIQIAMTVLFETGSDNEIQQILLDDDFHPYSMGHVVGLQIKQYMETDGFNEQGTKTWCPVTLQEVDCTANCRKFQDTIGYNPVPDPRIHTFLSTDSDKYLCTELCRHYQPEQNMGSAKGTIAREEAALPHIGEKATTYLGPTGITLDDPQYDYYTEALGVVERLRGTASDFYKKQVVSVFHGDVTKGMTNIRPTLILNVRSRWYGQHSYQNDAILQFFLSMVEYEGIVQIWREKFHHDLVRPTTVIKQWGNDTINTYGGDIDFNGPVDINARDFETLLPLMQSSPEFPSEHACYCTGVQELIDTFTTAQYGGTLSNIAFEALGSYIQILDLDEMVSKCTLGQIWGGFHFSDSIEAGHQKCLGLGDLAVEHMTDIVNLSDFNGGWNRGDTVPACPNR